MGTRVGESGVYVGTHGYRDGVCMHNMSTHGYKGGVCM